VKPTESEEVIDGYRVKVVKSLNLLKGKIDSSEHMDVKIFEADIIYHLFDAFTDYIQKIRNSEKKQLLRNLLYFLV